MDFSQTPCGRCDIAQEQARIMAIGLIEQRNRKAVDGRNNWQPSTKAADDFTVEVSASADNHQGPILVRIQGGRRVK